MIAASVDPIDKAKEVADELDFPIGYGVTRELGSALGSWWDDRRQFIQPSEFVLGPDNKVRASSYSDGPVARLLAADAISLITFLQSQS